jgi:hypothetical protein
MLLRKLRRLLQPDEWTSTVVREEPASLPIEVVCGVAIVRA